MSIFNEKVETIKALDEKSMTAINWATVFILFYTLIAQTYGFSINLKVIYTGAVLMSLFFVSRLLLSLAIQNVSKSAIHNDSNKKAIDEIKKISRNGLISSLLLGILVGNLAVTHISIEKAAGTASMQTQVNEELNEKIKRMEKDIKELKKDRNAN
ncbi:hypothetical protein [Pseudoalteromonas marina]|uniref:Uncharacterized protein n=1 Tax=Pseudoalteromonas marina TaxID=267375 RepID=A0ABT9FHW7_9GAMM|nr:hypothetical protein [Pseudoalteromonas marina]MDP2566374.1 hypothetical protein [Pseudoalteromonas marina]